MSHAIMFSAGISFVVTLKRAWYGEEWLPWAALTLSQAALALSVG